MVLNCTRERARERERERERERDGGGGRSSGPGDGDIDNLFCRKRSAESLSNMESELTLRQLELLRMFVDATGC